MLDALDNEFPVDQPRALVWFFDARGVYILVYVEEEHALSAARVAAVSSPYVAVEQSAYWCKDAAKDRVSWTWGTFPDTEERGEKTVIRRSRRIVRAPRGAWPCANCSEHFHSQEALATHQEAELAETSVTEKPHMRVFEVLIRRSREVVWSGDAVSAEAALRAYKDRLFEHLSAKYENFLDVSRATKGVEYDVRECTGSDLDSTSSDFGGK